MVSQRKVRQIEEIILISQLLNVEDGCTLILIVTCNIDKGWFTTGKELKTIFNSDSKGGVANIKPLSVYVCVYLWHRNSLTAGQILKRFFFNSKSLMNVG